MNLWHVPQLWWRWRWTNSTARFPNWLVYWYHYSITNKIQWSLVITSGGTEHQTCQYLHSIDIFTESVDDSTEWRCIEECHGSSHDTMEHAFVRLPAGLNTSSSQCKGRQQDAYSCWKSHLLWSHFIRNQVVNGETTIATLYETHCTIHSQTVVSLLCWKSLTRRQAFAVFSPGSQPKIGTNVSPYEYEYNSKCERLWKNGLRWKYHFAYRKIWRKRGS